MSKNTANVENDISEKFAKDLVNNVMVPKVEKFLLNNLNKDGVSKDTVRDLFVDLFNNVLDKKSELVDDPKIFDKYLTDEESGIGKLVKKVAKIGGVLNNKLEDDIGKVVDFMKKSQNIPKMSMKEALIFRISYVFNKIGCTSIAKSCMSLIKKENRKKLENLRKNISKSVGKVGDTITKIIDNKSSDKDGLTAAIIEKVGKHFDSAVKRLLNEAKDKNKSQNKGRSN